uniref:hypothetical protein n=1 Tax=Morganella psychrotolerans TaxID=368603 RepID=UPI0039B0D41E
MMLYTQIAATEPAGTEMTILDVMKKYRVYHSKAWSAFRVLEKTGAIEVTRRKGTTSVFRFTADAVGLIKAYEADVSLRRRLPRSEDRVTLTYQDISESAFKQKQNQLIA